MKTAVVIPIYKRLRAELKWYELISLRRVFEVLGAYPIVFIAPEGRSFDYIPRGSVIERFDSKYFDGKGGYNALMLNPEFYARFLAFECILIYQLDAFVFSDRLSEFAELEYDYIGAPWSMAAGLKSEPWLNVGNGGFSLRRVRACFDVLRTHADMVRSLSLPEDAMFSYLGRKFPTEFRVAPIRTASQFAVEHLPERWCRKNGGVLPFGCHGWYALSAEWYVRVFSEFGYDLEPYESGMGNFDRLNLDGYLRQLLSRRLTARLENGRPMRRYLPTTDERWYVMLADERSGVLARKLYSEGLRIVNGDRILIVGNDLMLARAAAEIKVSGCRALLLSLTDDSALATRLNIALGDGGGWTASYFQECVKRSAALLRRMSRPTVERLIKLGRLH